MRVREKQTNSAYCACATVASGGKGGAGKIMAVANSLSVPVRVGWWAAPSDVDSGSVSTDVPSGSIFKHCSVDATVGCRESVDVPACGFGGTCAVVVSLGLLDTVYS